MPHAGYERSSNSNCQHLFVFDSGATHHIVGCEGLRSRLERPPQVQQVRGIGGKLNVIGIGDLYVVDTEGRTLVLSGALYVPGATASLISVSCLASLGMQVLFLSNRIEVRSDSKLVFRTSLHGICASAFATGPKRELACHMHAPEVHMLSAPAHVSMYVLHRRLGHPSSAVMHHLISSKCADGIKMNLNSQLSAPCLACLQAKQPAVAHRVSESVTHRPLELVHVDLMGPLPKSMGGSQYIFVALDDFSRFSHVECLGSKGDAGPALLAVIALWERAITRKVISVRSDQGKFFAITLWMLCSAERALPIKQQFVTLRSKMGVRNE